MGYALLADRSRMPDATLTSNVAWSSTLDAVKTMPGTSASAARSASIGTAGSPVWIKAVLPDREACSYAGLFYTNLWQSAYVRLEMWADDGMTNLLFDTHDPVTGMHRRVVPSLYSPGSLRWGASNGFRGALPDEDFSLLPTHVHVPFDVVRPKVLRWSLWGPSYQPDGTEASYYDVGFSFLSDSLQLRRYLDSEDGYQPGDDMAQQVGGFVTVEPGTGHRTATVNHQLLDRESRDALTMLHRRANYDMPVVFLPDVDDDALNYMYGFVARVTNPLGHRFATSTLANSSTALREYIA